MRSVPYQWATMKKHRAYLALGGVAASMILSGCLVAAPGEPVYGPPVVVQEPPVATFSWGFWPHYDVEHHYVVEHDNVIIRDKHYFPFYGRTRPYIRSDDPRHRGRYQHDPR